MLLPGTCGGKLMGFQEPMFSCKIFLVNFKGESVDPFLANVPILYPMKAGVEWKH